MPNFPSSEEPCYDGCTCDGCWRGWTTQSKKTRAMSRLEHIVQNDVEVEHITPELARRKFEDVVDWLLDPAKS